MCPWLVSKLSAGDILIYRRWYDGFFNVLQSSECYLLVYKFLIKTIYFSCFYYKFLFFRVFCLLRFILKISCWCDFNDLIFVTYVKSQFVRISHNFPAQKRSSISISKITLMEFSWIFSKVIN